MFLHKTSACTLTLVSVLALAGEVVVVRKTSSAIPARALSDTRLAVVLAEIAEIMGLAEPRELHLQTGQTERAVNNTSYA
jgi:hypothetical protein